MFVVKVTQNQLDYARKLVENHNFAQRGIADGDKEDQFIGMLGQTVLADLLKYQPPEGGNGFDGGIDLYIGAHSVDVKTMKRKVDMQDYYVHNLIGFQSGYDVEYYVFLSYNAKKNEMTICGYKKKDEFYRKAKLYRKGTMRKRSDGTQFRLMADNYEIEQSQINQVRNIQDLINGINAGN